MGLGEQESKTCIPCKNGPKKNLPSLSILFMVKFLFVVSDISLNAITFLLLTAFVPNILATLGMHNLSLLLLE